MSNLKPTNRAVAHIQSLYVPQILRDQILAAAARAFPQECCGLIAGVAGGEGGQALTVHETPNLAPDPARNFLVDPQQHFELLRALRGTGRQIIGCFHSHPNGRAEPSPTDLERALEDGFIWLIASSGAADAEAFHLNAFVYEAAARSFFPLRIKP
jgi:proteasome lid subunit RPN8/RPN11